jgi:hypothetical protein
MIFHGSLEDNWDDFAVWELDCDSGDLRKITTVDAVNAALNSPENGQIGHIQPSADGSRFLFRYSSAQGKPRMGCIRISDGSLLSVFPRNKPMHYLWFDNETVMGANWLFKPEDHGNVDLAEFSRAVKERWYQRFKLEGGLIETLAGPTHHGAGSPDRNWYAGDPAPENRPPVTLSLYRRGHTEPTAILMKHPFKKLTVSQKVHVNPSFSRDGKRVYFFRAVSEERFKASFVDISELIAGGRQ